MNNDRNAFRAGLFIITSLVLCLVIIVSIKGLGAFFDRKVQRQASFSLTDDLGGLRVGDDVRLGGFKVGEVLKIEPINVEQGAVREPRLVIYFNLSDKIALRRDAKMGMQSTLTGTAWLNIESLGADKTLADESTLFVGNPNPISAIFASMGQTMPDIKSIASDIRTKTLPQVTETTTNAKEAIAIFKTKIDPVSERTIDMLTQIRDFFGNSKGDWRDSIGNIKVATAAMREKLPSILEKADASMEKVKETLEDVKKTAANSKDLTGNVKDIIQRNRGKIDQMIASAKGTAENLKGAAGEVRRAPWRILYKPNANDMNNITLFDAARQFADGAGELNDAATSLRDAMQNPNLDQSESQKLMDKLSRTFDKFKDVEDKLWKAAKE